MNCQKWGACLLNLLGKVNCILFIWQASYLASHWDLEVLLKFLHHRHDQVSLLKKKWTVVTFSGDALRTSKVYIYGVTVVFDIFSCSQKDVWVVGTELYNKWSILRRGSKHVFPVFLRGAKQPCMEHWRVANVGAILSSQHSVWQLWLINHWRHKVFRTSNLVVECIRVSRWFHYWLVMYKCIREAAFAK